MRKIQSLIFAAAFMAAACSQTEPEAQEMPAPEPVTAHIATQTRTSLEPAEAGTYKVNWNEGDEIIISNGKMEAIYRTYDSGSPSAAFLPVNRISMDFSKGIIAAYPTEEMYLGNPDANEEIYLNIPTEQTYVPGSFADEAMPMVSDVAYEPVLNFKNAAGVLKLNVSCASETVKIASITVTTTESISGECCYVPAEGQYFQDSSLQSENFVNLDCGEGVETGSEPVSFHIVVPNQTYTDMNITVTAVDGRKHIFRMKADKDITVARSSILTIPLKINIFGEEKKAEVTITKGTVSYTRFTVNVSMKNVGSYYCGLQSKDSFHTEVGNGDFFDVLQWKTVYTTPMSYSGSISSFQEECGDVLIEPGHEYVFWIIPQKTSGEYSESDITYIEVKTKSYTSGGNITLSTSQEEVGMRELSLKLTASSNVLIIYNMLLSKEELAQYPTEQDRIDLLLSGDAYFFERSSDIVVKKFLSPGTEYTFIAIAVNSSGKYGPLLSQTFTTLSIPYNSLTVRIDKDLQKLREDQTIRWSVEGGEATGYRYIFTTKSQYLWTNTLKASIGKADELMALDPGLYYISNTTAPEIKVSLQDGKEYIFILTAVDSEGYTAESSWWEFTY